MELGEGAEGLGRGGTGGKKGAFGGPPVPAPTPAPHPDAPSPGGVHVEGSASPSLALAPGGPLLVLRHPGCPRPAPTGPPHASRSPRSARTSRPALRGWGAIALCLSGKTLGKAGAPAPPAQPCRPSPALSSWLSLNVLQRRPPPTPTPSLRFPGSFAARSPASPTPRGAAHTRPVRMHGVRARGAGPGTLSHVPLATGTAQRQRPFTEPPRTLP